MSARKPLNENTDASIGQFEHPHNDGDRAEFMEVFGLGVIHIGRLL